MYALLELRLIENTIIYELYKNKDLHSFQPPYNTNEKGGELK